MKMFAVPKVCWFYRWQNVHTDSVGCIQYIDVYVYAIWICGMSDVYCVLISWNQSTGWQEVCHKPALFHLISGPLFAIICLIFKDTTKITPQISFSMWTGNKYYLIHTSPHPTFCLYYCQLSWLYFDIWLLFNPLNTAVVSFRAGDFVLGILSCYLFSYRWVWQFCMYVSSCYSIHWLSLVVLLETYQHLVQNNIG